MKKKTYAAIAIGGGAATLAGLWWASRKSAATVDNITKAVSGASPPKPGEKYPTAQLRLTHYFPWAAVSAAEKKMEGGVNDRKGKPLHSVEDFLAGKSDHVSLSGDDSIWPYGQKLLVPWGDKMLVGRVTDTGGHFRGMGKVVRAVGYEPIDVCVYDKSNKPPKTLVTAQIVPGDSYDKTAKAVATAKLAQNIAGDVLEGRTLHDREALARAIESELGGHSQKEQFAAAWAMRNRADVLGVSLHSMLAPRGEYGSPHKSSGYASTRKVPTDQALAIADQVLDASSHDDPTCGATEFWMPAQQDKLHSLGEIYRAASSSGDAARAQKYARYSPYASEFDVRVQHMRDGLEVLGAIGSIELLAKRRG